MSLTDNIVSGAILLTVLIATGAIIVSQSIETTNERFDFRQTSYLLDKHEGSLNTIMTITEPETRQSYARLLARSIYENHDAIDLPDGGEVNISDLIDDALGMVFGAGNYYAEIRPYISDVHIRIVFDGTSSLDNERDIIGDRIDEIIDRTRTIAADRFGGSSAPDITFHISIVANDDDPCDAFATVTVEGFAGCEVVSRADAYAVISEPELGFTPNPIYGSSGNEVYYQGDWAAGIATSLTDLIDGEPPVDYAESLIIIFPITDELTTGSIPDECYVSGEPLRPTGTSEDALGWNAGYCAFCNEACPLERSQAQIDQLDALIGTYDGLSDRIVISGVFSEDCTTSYASAYNDPPNFVKTTGYIDQYIDTAGEYTVGSGTYCDFNNCSGCTTNEDDATMICWRSGCTEQTTEQIEDLSNRYGGSLIDLTDVEELPDEILRTISAAADALVTSYGEKREEDSRFVATYSILLPNNERVPFTAWIYEDREFSDSIPQVAIEAQPKEIPPGDTIRLLTHTRIENTVANVRIRPAITGTDWLEANLLSIMGNDRTYQTLFSTDGLQDGFYDVDYELYDSNFNVYRDTITDVFQIDSSLIPAPHPENNIILSERYPKDTPADAVVSIINAGESAEVVSVHITIIAPDLSERTIALFGSYDSWSTSFDVESLIGIHRVAVIIEDSLGRTIRYGPLDDYEVLDTVPCDDRSVCNGWFCVSETEPDDDPNTDEFYCRDTAGQEGEYAAESESCRSSLTFDANTGECYDSGETYDLVFVPLLGSGQTLSDFDGFVADSMNAFYTVSPMQECSNRQDVFRYHIVERDDCRSAGCTNDYQTLSTCFADALECARDEYPYLADRTFGVTTFNWPYGGGYIAGAAPGTPSNVMVSWEGSGMGTMLHEGGHTWGLGHLRMDVIQSQEPCQNPNNDADCAIEEAAFIMNYRQPQTRFGPNGYAFMRDVQFASAFNRCE